jgi:hypothetical protein
MAGENEFFPFAAGGGANVIDQVAYEADTTLRANGFVAGVAESDVLNKVWRQSTFVAAAVAQLIANNEEDAEDNGDLSEFVLKLTNAISAIAAAVPSTPTGSVIWYAANAAPTGYLEADGAAVSRTTYAALFTAIGTTFGAGDGSTTFNLPDLRGEFIRGWDDGAEWIQLVCLVLRKQTPCGPTPTCIPTLKLVPLVLITVLAVLKPILLPMAALLVLLAVLKLGHAT